MMTREGLLTMAERYLGDAAVRMEGPQCRPDLAMVNATLAQACVMLAKEMREGENAKANNAVSTVTVTYKDKCRTFPGYVSNEEINEWLDEMAKEG